MIYRDHIFEYRKRGGATERERRVKEREKGSKKKKKAVLQLTDILI